MMLTRRNDAVISYERVYLGKRFMKTRCNVTTKVYQMVKQYSFLAAQYLMYAQCTLILKSLHVHMVRLCVSRYCWNKL